MKIKLSVCKITFSDMRDFDRSLLHSPRNRKNLAVTSYSPDQCTLASLCPVKVILTLADGTQEAEGAGMDKDGIFCTLVYILAACIARKRCGTASSVVVKVLSKAISDQIRSADGSVMTLSCMLLPLQGR